MLTHWREGRHLIHQEWRVLALGLLVGGITTLLIFLFFPLSRALDLATFFGYIVAGTTFIPLPTPQWVMVYGERFNPGLLALVGGIGTSIACLFDYPLVSFAFRFKNIARIKTTKVYQRSIQLFSKAPFLTLLIAAFTPVPWEPFRVLAATSRYDRFRYILSAFLGRTPRYFLLAELQRNYLRIPGEFLLGSIVLLLLFAAAKIWLRKPRGTSEKETAERL